MNVVRKILEKINVSLLMMFVLMQQAFADIPKSDDFLDDADDQKGGLELLFYLIEKFVQVVIIALVIYMVVLIFKGGAKKYDDITNERATWMDLGGHIIGGIAILTLGIIMFNWVGSWVD